MKTLFFAIQISPVSINALAGIQDLMRGLPGVSLTDPGKLHLTLKYLGPVDESLLGLVKSAGKTAAKTLQPFEFSITGIGCFPDSKRPAVVWAGIDDNGDFGFAENKLTEALSNRGIERSDRPFTAHITLGRVRNARERARADFPRFPSFNLAEKARSLTLLESVKQGGTTVYETLGTFTFAAGRRYC